VRGVDSSAEMIASTPSGSRVSFSVRAAQDLDTVGVDVLVSNAALQWVPQHPELLTTWADQLNDDGWIAFQVPSNFGAPSHRLMAELADSPRCGHGPREPLANRGKSARSPAHNGRARVMWGTIGSGRRSDRALGSGAGSAVARRRVRVGGDSGQVSCPSRSW